MEYRLDKNQLLELMVEWNRFLKRKVHLIACGGTAMTLLGVKESTKMTPQKVINAPRMGRPNQWIAAQAVDL